MQTSLLFPHHQNAIKNWLDLSIYRIKLSDLIRPPPFSCVIAAVSRVVWLVILTIFTGNSWKLTTFGIYGVTLILTFVFAALYQGTSGQAKTVFSKLDHASIYLLIADTYTPYALITLRDTVGWPIF